MRATCFRSFGLSSSSQSKSGTSAAIFTGDADTQNSRSDARRCHRATIAAQTFILPLPNGVTQPMPVMTTRRGLCQA